MRSFFKLSSFWKTCSVVLLLVLCIALFLATGVIGHTTIISQSIFSNRVMNASQAALPANTFSLSESPFAKEIQFLATPNEQLPEFLGLEERTAVLFLLDESGGVSGPRCGQNGVDEDGIRYDLAQFFLVLFRTYYTQDWRFDHVTPLTNERELGHVQLGVSQFASHYYSGTFPLTPIEALSPSQRFSQVYEKLDQSIEFPPDFGCGTNYCEALEIATQELEHTRATRRVLIMFTDGSHKGQIGGNNEQIIETLSDIHNKLNPVEIYVMLWGVPQNDQSDAYDFWLARAQEGYITLLESQSPYESIGTIPAINALLPSQYSGWLNSSSSVQDWFPGGEELSRVTIITSKSISCEDLSVADGNGIDYVARRRGRKWLQYSAISQSTARECSLHTFKVENNQRLDMDAYYWMTTNSYNPQLRPPSISPSNTLIMNSDAQVTVHVELDSDTLPQYPMCYFITTTVGAESVSPQTKTLGQNSGALDFAFDLTRDLDLAWGEVTITTELVYAGASGILSQVQTTSLSIRYEPRVITREIEMSTSASWEQMEKEIDDHLVTFTFPIEYAAHVPGFVPSVTLSADSSATGEKNCRSPKEIENAIKPTEQWKDESSKTVYYQVVFDYKTMLELGCKYEYLNIHWDMPYSSEAWHRIDRLTLTLTPTPTPIQEEEQQQPSPPWWVVVIIILSTAWVIMAIWYIRKIK